jgi:DNA replication licensing factor MCM3
MMCAHDADIVCSFAEFVMEGDLVDACKPGDRVLMTGIYRPLTGRANANIQSVRSIVVVNSVEQLSNTTTESSEITPDDLKEMKKLSNKTNILEVLGKSLAPSIYGHLEIKKVRTKAQWLPLSQA